MPAKTATDTHGIQDTNKISVTTQLEEPNSKCLLVMYGEYLIINEYPPYNFVSKMAPMLAEPGV